MWSELSSLLLIDNVTRVIFSILLIDNVVRVIFSMLFIDNAVSEMRGLSNCKRLRFLSLAHNHIKKMEGMTGLNIRHLCLVSQPTFDNVILAVGL